MSYTAITNPLIASKGTDTSTVDAVFSFLAIVLYEQSLTATSYRDMGVTLCSLCVPVDHNLILFIIYNLNALRCSWNSIF